MTVLPTPSWPNSLDPLLDHGAGVVPLPGSQRREVVEVGDDRGEQLDAAVIRQQLPLGALGSDRLPAPHSYETRAPQRAARRLEPSIPGCAAPVVQLRQYLMMSAHLQQIVDAEPLEPVDQRAREEPFVESHDDSLHPDGAQPRDPRLEPRLTARRRVRAGPPHDSQAVDRLLNEGQQRIMARPCPASSGCSLTRHWPASRRGATVASRPHHSAPSRSSATRSWSCCVPRPT